ncbi:sugar ABC transporter substrate-binding protein [Haloferula helveola]|uniref:Sugar ABC transporter substrate-binding protein n=1 Tax=Haloferula helveola TaxID=490095 RepID=A0ABM7RCI8_9BACT|nr:sugar ABC transporter substrate-binding protein [Haloferula helveola]
MNLRPLLLILTVLAGLAYPAAMGQGERASGSIGSRDSVEITVFREDDLTTRGQLSAAGTIDIPLIGAVKLSGLTTSQAARAIEAKLRDGYLVKPEVTVSITDRVRKTVTVLGQVQKPGVFRLDPNRQLTLVEALGMAGGMTRIANDKKVTLKRRGSSQPQRINVRSITSGEAKDITLRDGDIITIPESLF